MTELPPPAVLLTLSSTHAVTRALHVVADAGVADAFDDAPATTDALAQASGCDPDALGRLLTLLECVGVFQGAGEGKWAHTEVSRWLRSDHPFSMRAFVRMTGLPFFWGGLGNLAHSAQTGSPATDLLDEGGVWSYLDAHPEEREVFDAAMTAKAHADVGAVLEAYEFSEFERIVDVGGGAGHLVSAILDRHRSAKGVLVDLPHVAETVAASDRLEVVGADFFEDPLPTGDCYLLMNIVHDWADAEALAILRAVREAAAPGATVLLVEAILPTAADPMASWVFSLDVLMLALTGGRERSVQDYDELLANAHLTLQSVTTTASPSSVIEATVADR